MYRHFDTHQLRVSGLPVPPLEAGPYEVQSNRKSAPNLVPDRDTVHLSRIGRAYGSAGGNVGSR